MYRAAANTLVALGGPVGPLEEWKDVILEFRKMADLYDTNPVFSEIAPEHLYLYLDAGLSAIKLGEKARVRVPSFSLEGSGRSEFRHTLRHLEKSGLSFEIVPREEVPSVESGLKAVSDRWLAKKNTKEKGFSLGFFDERYLRFCPHAVLRQNGRIVAFANLWIGAEKEELGPDLVRYDPGIAPNGAMDFLMVRLILWGAENGFEWLNLGVAPLAGVEDGPFSSIWNRVGSALYHRTKYFYNFEGLRAYKEKFDPVWTPVYLAYPGGFSLPRVLADVAILNSGGIQGLFSK